MVAPYVAINMVFRDLGLDYTEIASILGTTATSVRGWHLSDRFPRKRQFNKLKDLYAMALLITQKFPDSEKAMKWLHNRNPLLHSIAPITLIKGGEFEPIHRLLGE